jgi:hypothetical protein
MYTEYCKGRPPGPKTVMEAIGVAKFECATAGSKLLKDELSKLLTYIDNNNSKVSKLFFYDSIYRVLMYSAAVGMFTWDSPLSELERSIKMEHSRSTLLERVAERRSRMRPFIVEIIKLRDDIGPHLGHKVLVKEMYRQLMADESFRATFQGTERQIKKDLHAILIPADEEDELNDGPEPNE